jgi:hypothetical protein
MKYKDDIVIILDSILDDYYYLWECFLEYSQIRNSVKDSRYTFSEALKMAYEKKYFDFFIGKDFNGDEKLIPGFNLTNSTIEDLLNYKYTPTKEIRITTSKLGRDFLGKCYNPLG